jgi:poly(3-hydroxybutyrate) depolymerase
VHPVNGEHVLAQAGAGAALTTHVSRESPPGRHAYTRTVHTDAQRRPVLEHWLLHGAGHAWSGGSAAGSYTDPQGPDASREMMRFFAQQPGPGSR